MRRSTMMTIVGLVLITAVCGSVAELPATPWPPEFAIRVNRDVEIQFAYPDGPEDWISSAFIRYEPSSSLVGVNGEGFLSYQEIYDLEAVFAICAVLSDEEMMSRVKSRAVELNAPTFGQRLVDDGLCGFADPPTISPTREAGSGLNLHFPARPDGYNMRVDGDVEIGFAYPGANLDWSAAIVVEHTPSSSFVGLDRSGRATRQTINGAEARSAICAVLSDEALMAQLISRVEGIVGAFVFSAAPLEPGPCEDSGPASLSETVAPLTLEELEEFFQRAINEGSDEWPRGYSLRVNDDVEIRYAYPARVADWNASVFIRHDPSGSSIGVNQAG